MGRTGVISNEVNHMDKHEAWSRIIGNEVLKRAIEVALAGKHTITIFGHHDDGEIYLREILGDKLLFRPPCPCGNLGSLHRECSCTVGQIRNYRKTQKFQRVLLSDIKATINSPRSSDFERMSEPFLEVEKRINSMRSQVEDFKDEASQQLFKAAYERLHLTTGMALRIKAVARTIARLDHASIVRSNHLSEAIQYAMEGTR